MTRSTSWAGQHPEIQKYLKFINDDSNTFHCESTESSNVYTPRSTLQKYFSEGQGSIDEILRRVLLDEEHMVPTDDAVLQHYLGIFTILLSIGQGHHLNRFIERDYSDEKLPFFDRPRHFPKPETGSFFDAFFDAQFQFCPVRFSKNPVNLLIEPEQILPLKSKEKIASSGIYTTFRVELHEEYDPFGEDLGPIEIELGTKKPSTHRYLFKQFHGKSSKSCYDKELIVFLYLQRSAQLLGKAVLGFHGSFIQDDIYTIILEDPDRGSLENFMSSNAPPSNGEDITRLWESMLRLHEALHAVYNMNAPYSEDVRNYSMLRGWHQNLSVNSIFAVTGQTNSEYDCEFRLGDLGILHDTITDKTYFAPECSESAFDIHMVNMQMADMWSLGCIYSEFAIWTSLGFVGLRDYRANREYECRSARYANISAFHDGKNLLPCVTAWHEQAIACKNGGDRASEAVLQQLVEEMLCEDGDARPSTRQLKMKSTKILSRAREQHLAELRRNDSVASTATSLSSLSLSSKGWKSHRASLRSDTSVESASNDTVAAQNRIGRSPTTVSAKSYRDSHASPPIIEEEKEVPSPFESVPQTTSPTSPMNPRQLQLSPGRSRVSYGSAQDFERGDVPASLSPRTSRTPTLLRLDASVLNGDDKEITVLRSLPPIALRRKPISTSNENDVQEGLPNKAESNPQPLSKVQQPESNTTLDPTPRNIVVKIEEPPAYSPVDVRPDHDPQHLTLPSEDSRNAGTVTSSEVDLRRSLSTPSGQLTQELHQRKSSDLRRSATTPSGSKPEASTDDFTTTSRPTTSASVSIYKPFLDLFDGLIWLNQRKGSASSESIRDESYIATLADRDYIFLIDDGGSMRPHREMVSRAVRLLSWLLKKYDKNGMDIYFSQKAEKTHTRPGHSSDLQKPLLKSLDNCKGRSNLTARLTQILQDYRERNAAGSGAQQQSSRSSFASIGSGGKIVTGAKKIVVYVFTDGNWEEGAEDRLLDRLKALGVTLRLQGAPEKAVGVQFICTVDNPEVKRKLQKLKGCDYADRITTDTEFLEGNVFRLLLGSVSDLWKEPETL